MKTGLCKLFFPVVAALELKYLAGFVGFEVLIGHANNAFL
jgi:hypothetical protein